MIVRSVSTQLWNMYCLGEMNLRFQPDNVTQKLAFISLVVTHLTGPIDQLNAFHPLVRRQLDFAGKIMYMFRQAPHNLPHAR